MIRGYIILGLTLAAAALAGSDALGRAINQRLPEVASNLPTARGFDKSRLASVTLAPGLEGGLLKDIKLAPAELRRVAALSREGYRREPLNSDAIRNLALLAHNEGRIGDARLLMRAAVRLTKRDLAVNIWLADDYARLGQIGPSLDMYDQGLRSSARAQELIIPAMIQSLGSEEMVQPLVDLLSKRPPWQAEFWAAAPRYNNAHGNLARIRLALADRKIPAPANSDRELVEALAGSGHVALASALVDRLAPPEPDRRNEVRNAEFSRAQRFLPFDWQPMFDGSLTSDLDPRAGTLRISVYGEGGGTAARQLVALPGGSYRLVAKAANWNPGQSGRLYFRLRCAEPGKTAESNPIPLVSERLSVLIKPAAGCTYHWLTVYITPSDQGGENAVTLDSVSLKRAAD